MRTRLPLVLSFGLLACSGLALASENGISGYSGNPGINNGNSCDTCHSGGATPSVDIAGPMTVMPGSTNTYTLTISGGQSAWGGLDVSATLGALSTITGEGTRISSGEIVQSARKAAVGSDVSFSFNWTAPSSPGTAALYGAGLSANGSGTGGDGVGLVALVISVESTPAPNQPPVSVPGGPYTGTTGTPVAFNGSGSYDPDGTIVSYTWEFGDGSLGNGATPSYAYAAAGSYTVSLTVTDDAGDSNTMTTVANVNDPSPSNQMPVANAGGPYAAVVGDMISFDGSGSSDPDGTVVAWSWDFGDGSTGNGMSVQHTYSSPASYPVILTVTDDLGASSSDRTDATVRDAGTPSLLVFIQARRMAWLDGDGGEMKVGVTADLSSLPPGTTGCGTATLFKNDVAVGTESICVSGDDDYGEDDDVDDDDGPRSSNRTMRVKSARGTVSMARAGSNSARARFEVELSPTDAPSVVWTAEVDFAGYFGEATPVTTQLTERRRR